MARELLIHKYVREVSAQGKYNVEHSKELTKSLVDIYLEDKCRDVLIVACGSSYNGSNCARTFMEKVLKRHVRVISPENFEFFDNLIPEDEMIVVVSFSGASTNSISALEKLKAEGRRAIGLSGYPESDFKHVADLSLGFGLGEENEPYETKGVTLTGLFFDLFALEAAFATGSINEEEYKSYKEQMMVALDAHDDVLNRTNDFINEHDRELFGMEMVSFVGTGAAYALSLEAKLKFGELLKICTDAQELEEWNHGPNLKLKPNHVLFFMDCSKKTSERTIQTAMAARQVTPYAFVLTPNKEVKEEGVFYLPEVNVDDTLLPLYGLVFYQEMVATLTDMRHAMWDSHLIKNMEKACPTKSSKYNKGYIEML